VDREASRVALITRIRAFVLDIARLVTFLLSVRAARSKLTSYILAPASRLSLAGDLGGGGMRARE
jgi:hypothetical protein